MRNLYLLSIVLLFSYSTQAQNWKTVVSGDTTYFRGGQHESSWSYFDNDNLSDALRMIFIAYSGTLSGDSAFYFYNTLRVEDMNQCVDTTAATWLGKMFLRQNDGTELYFNSLNDTVVIRTQAQVGDSWILATDSTGLTFHATIANAGTTTIEGVNDSFKRLVIQAYQNTTPVQHYYNSTILEWSKNYGWITTLDLNRFPNQGNGWETFGVIVDTSQCSRVDNGFAQLDYQKVDLLWKYTPGNEWISHSEGGTVLFNSPYNGAYKTIIHDSIISSNLISTNTIVVSYQRKSYTLGNWQYVTGTNPHWVHTSSSMTTLITDTVSNQNSGPLIDTIKPELIYPDLSTFLSQDLYRSHDRYFIDTFCNKPIIKHYRAIGEHLFYTNNCWELQSSISGGSVTSSEYLTGFGQIKYYHAYSGFSLHPQTLDQYQKRYHSYLKLGSCTYGTKIDVIALNAGNIEKENAIAVFPNPANEYVIIRSSSADKDATLSLMDVNGRLLSQQTGVLQENKIDTKQLAPGLYFIKLQGKRATQVAKVVVQ